MSVPRADVLLVETAANGTAEGLRAVEARLMMLDPVGYVSSTPRRGDAPEVVRSRASVTEGLERSSVRALDRPVAILQESL